MLSARLAVLNCIRVLIGNTRAESAETVFDTDEFVEKKYVEYIHSTSGNISLALNWCVTYKKYKGQLHSIPVFRYNSFKVMLLQREHHSHVEHVKVVSYYCVGYIQEAAELGFGVYQTRGSHPKFAIYSLYLRHPDPITVTDMYGMLFSFTVLPYLPASATVSCPEINNRGILPKLRQMIST